MERSLAQFKSNGKPQKENNHRSNVVCIVSKRSTHSSLEVGWMIDGWMDGWVDERVDGWTDGWIRCIYLLLILSEKSKFDNHL